MSGLKRNKCPDNPGIGGWIAPEYASNALLENRAVQVSLWVAAVAAVLAILISLSRQQRGQA